jgi:hypothetical protein
MIGFGEVRWRMKCQEQETKLHQAFLDRVAEDIAELQRRHTATVAKIAEYRRKFLDLEHRVLQVCHTFCLTFACRATVYYADLCLLYTIKQNVCPFYMHLDTRIMIL